MLDINSNQEERSEANDDAEDKSKDSMFENNEAEDYVEAAEGVVTGLESNENAVEEKYVDKNQEYEQCDMVEEKDEEEDYNSDDSEPFYDRFAMVKQTSMFVEDPDKHRFEYVDTDGKSEYVE